MDEYAAMSFQRASEAQRAGRFTDEIVPIEAFQAVGPAPKDGAKQERKKVLISQDDGIRHGTTAESLGKIRAAFPQWPPANTTGGNASQITDGGAAVLMMRRDEAERLNLPILAKSVAITTAGLPPRIMGIGTCRVRLRLTVQARPSQSRAFSASLASRRTRSTSGRSTRLLPCVENEAELTLQSMYVYCVTKLGLDKSKGA